MRRDKTKKEEESDDVAGRFPNSETDDRLKVTQIPLPEVPKREWKPPQTEAAGTKVAGPGTVAEFRGMGVGYSIGLTLVTSILIGTGMGWAVDTYLLHNKGTPWGLIIGFLAGTVNGFVQMIQITNRLNAEEEQRTKRGGR